MAVFHGDITAGLRVSPDQQGPPMLPPHLASALGTSATDTSTLLLTFFTSVRPSLEHTRCFACMLRHFGKQVWSAHYSACYIV